MNLPNFLTLLRIAAVPLIVWLLMEGLSIWALWIFIAAGITDALDGFIAKQFDMETQLGQFLDPLADKVLLVSIYVTLGIEGTLASWLVILVVFRDVLIVGGAILFETMTHTLTMQPLMISKVNTAAQIVLAAVVMGRAGYGLDLGILPDILMGMTALLTVSSGLVYAIKWTKRWSELENTR